MTTLGQTANGYQVRFSLWNCVLSELPVGGSRLSSVAARTSLFKRKIWQTPTGWGRDQNGVATLRFLQGLTDGSQQTMRMARVALERLYGLIVERDHLAVSDAEKPVRGAMTENSMRLHATQ